MNTSKPTTSAPGEHAHRLYQEVHMEVPSPTAEGGGGGWGWGAKTSSLVPFSCRLSLSETKKF